MPFDAFVGLIALAVQEDSQILDNLGVLYISSSKLKEAQEIYEILDKKYPEYREGKVHYNILYM
ncbi:unnamed protein product [Oppiella nova]|uniref:Tetratricopeptide repeat protein n=1 Tax=Oppiella nova TaxID=334625 RepID=A0A7R9M786_9ACAR|nr:unnamed protein product [Oppiella nova]CAG2171956.1 unnamed protein product [Oppiella nova]